jgi:Ser/Thr protein kinase RdoA (MazF antagonist)
VESYSQNKTKQPQHQIQPIRINRNTRARTDKQKTTAFAEHLASVFHPFPSQVLAMDEETIKTELNAPHQMALPIKKNRISEVINVIK